MSDPSASGRKRRLLIGAAVLAVAAAAAGTGLALTSGGSSAPKSPGVVVDRTIPDRPLLDEQGRKTSLAAWRGKVVVVAPFLTLCHEVCPLTTGAFVELQRSVTAAGLGDRVVFAEISTDPWRDTPARLRAFERMTGIRFPLLTGTKAQLTAFWHDLGVGFSKSPEGSPPDTDWLTGKPLTFDVTHNDGLFVIGPDGRWRTALLGMPSVAGKLSPALMRLLNAEGRSELAHPQAAWTIAQGLDAIGFVLRRRIPPAT